MLEEAQQSLTAEEEEFVSRIVNEVKRVARATAMVESAISPDADIKLWAMKGCYAFGTRLGEQARTLLIEMLKES